jgi:hypothetical protein
MRWHRIENLYQSGGESIFVHWTGGSAIDAILVANNLRTSAPISVYVDGQKFDDGKFKVKSVTSIGNAWNRPHSGGYYARFNEVGTAVHQFNKGPLRSLWPVERQIVFERCGTTVNEFAGLWRAGQKPAGSVATFAAQVEAELPDDVKKEKKDKGKVDFAVEPESVPPMDEAALG